VPRFINYLQILILLIFVSGCSVIPVPLSQDELSGQASKDRIAVTHNQEPVTEAISIHESMARALKYNLDFHVELSQKILSQVDLDLSRYELLPQLVTDIGFNSRNNFSGASSRSLLTGIQSLQSSTSSERDVFTANLNLSWNVLDFGLSYVRSQQAADKILVAEEEKRKVVNRIVQDVRTAYWRAVSSERLINKLEQLLVRVNRAIEESKQVEAQRLDRPLTALTYQRELIGIKRELEELQRDLSFAKIQLAALMNLRPGEDFQIIIPDRTLNMRNVDISPVMLEQLALENRPELRTVAYQQRINKNETKAAILGLLPGIEVNFGPSYSSNSFLFHNNWLAYGAQIGWNLLNAFKLPATQRKIEATDKLFEAQRLAISMAVMTQVHVSLARYMHSRKEYQTAADYYYTQEKILEQLISGVATSAVTEQALIREEMNMLLAEVKFDIAYSDMESAYASIFAALGIDPLPGDIESEDIRSMSAAIRESFDAMSLYDQLYSMKINMREE
jgi:outer membrane protein TolC